MSERDALLAIARVRFREYQALMKSWVGSDVVLAALREAEWRAYAALADGAELDAVIATEDAKWRAYAARMADKIADAAKVKRGPQRGLSSLAHLHVNADAWADLVTLSLRRYAEVCKTDPARIIASFRVD